MPAGKESLVDHFEGQKDLRSRRRRPIKEEAGSPSPPPSLASFPSEFLGRYAFRKEEELNKNHQEKKEHDLKAVSTRSTRDFVNVHPRKKRRRGNEVTVKQEEVSGEAGEYLPNVPDHVKADMDILMIGSNPGRMSSRKGQHFSHPSNHFYKALHLSGLTPCQVSPSLDYTLLEQEKPFFSIGLTNLAARPTRMAHELGRSEEELGTEILIKLIKKHRPRVGVFVGIGVSRSFESSLAQLELKTRKEETSWKEKEGRDTFVQVTVGMDIPLVRDSTLGLGVGLMSVGIRHDEGDGFTLLFAMPSTSGRVTTHQLKEKATCMEWARVMTQQLAADRQGDKQVPVRLV